MPLTAKTFIHKFQNEDGADESLTFRYPTTLERIDAVAEMQAIYGSMEAADAEKEELAEQFGMERVRDLVEWCNKWGKRLLSHAEVSYEENGKPAVNVTDVDGWEQKLADDLFYGEQLEAGMLAFFREVLAVRMADAREPAGE